MIFRSRAPLRLGLAGGGTDVSPFSEIYGGCILNATISLYASCSIEPSDSGKIHLVSIDRDEATELPSQPTLPTNGVLDLAKSVYNRVVSDFIGEPLSFKLTSFVDAPAGSGLGSSSTLTVAMLSAFAAWKGLPLGEYDMAHLAYGIERVDLRWAGGKQDQYAATFGGFNFMEFGGNDKVIVNPLRIRGDLVRELETNIVLYYMGTSRLSGEIIQTQTENVSSGNEKSLEGMQKLKEQAVLMKEAILKGRLTDIGPLLDFGWKYKKQTSNVISNALIDEIYESALAAGATGGKISGAGGGGFMMFFCPGNTRYQVIQRLKVFGGEFRRFQFVETGAVSWSAK